MVGMGEGESGRPSRRKPIGDRVDSGRNDSAHSGNGVVIDDSSFAPFKATTTNEKARSRRRKKIEARRRKTESRLVTWIYIAVCFFICFYMAMFMWSAPPPLDSSPPASTSSHYPVDKDKENTSNIGSDTFLSKIPNNNEPLTEEQEQEILNAARDEWNQFPLSIGKDDDASNNPNWENIVHPGTAAMKHFTGKSPHWKRRATASDLAGVLAGKKLRGGRDNIEDAKGDNNGSPGNNNIGEDYMRVPKFWDPLPYRTIADERERRSGVHPSDADDLLPRDGVRRYLGNFGSRLMTPAEAKSIGSHVTGSNGEQLETIFVAIASYRDWQCSSTVESVFLRASHPERIRVAVVDQLRLDKDASCSVPPGGPCEQNPDQATCKHQSQIDYFTVDAELSVGPVFARHLGHRLYRGEYFAMQSDAHVAFVVGWDDDIIEQWHTAKNEMAVLSTYLSGTNNHIDLKTGKRTSKSRPIMCLSDFEGAGGFKHLRHGQQPEGVPFIHDMPTLNPYWAAGFSFGRGHFVVNIPYDQHLPWIFQGEEISIGLRGFSYGYDYYSPERSACYHFYGRKNVPMFWENTDTFRGSGLYGMNRLNAIIHMEMPSINGEAKEWIRTDELKYGIGKVRDLQTFFDIFGIHVEKQKVERHLCRFVGRPMQKEFIPFLRTNEMGLDYDRITYRFEDQWKDEKDDDLE